MSAVRLFLHSLDDLVDVLSDRREPACKLQQQPDNERYDDSTTQNRTKSEAYASDEIHLVYLHSATVEIVKQFFDNLLAGTIFGACLNGFGDIFA